MSTNTQALRTLRRFRTDLVLAALVATASLLAVPRPTHPEPVPTAPAVADTIPGQDGLCRLIASLDLGRPEPVTRAPDRHALRRQVTPFAVRLVVDPAATHPLDGRLTVRRTHLGGPAKTWRLVSLTLPPVDPEPPAQPVATQAAAPEPEKALPVVASAAPQPVVVKNPSTPPAPARVAAPRPMAQAPISPPGRSVLVAGDSLSIFLADALRPLLAGRPGTTFAAKGKVSSGLARPDFFDWEREMARQSAATRADTVLIMIATNDNQTLTRPDGVKVAFGRSGWEAEYTRRVRRLVERSIPVLYRCAAGTTALYPAHGGRPPVPCPVMAGNRSPVPGPLCRCLAVGPSQPVNGPLLPANSRGCSRNSARRPVTGPRG